MAATPTDPDAPLRADVRRLGAMLGDTLRARGREGLFDAVERVRALSKASRGGDDDAFLRLAALLSEQPVDSAVPVARAFAQFLGLANIAEQHHRVRRRRAYAAEPDGEPQPGSPSAVVAALVAAGHAPERVAETFAGLEIELVLTAHPTEAARRTTLRKHRRIGALLDERDRADRSPAERDAIETRLRRAVLELWETDEIRAERPTPEDEARWGLAVVEQTLWDAVPAVLAEIDRALIRHAGHGLPTEAAPIRFASWMGGDRDGNPNVTAEVTRRTLLLSRWMAADLFHREVERLRGELSIRPASDELRDRVGDAPEPYRALLRDLRRRLTATRRAVERELGASGSGTPAEEAAPIETRDDLLEPLRLTDRSLRAVGCDALADGTLRDLLRRVACFGATLLRLDLRQDATPHAEVLDAVTRGLGLQAYRDRDEDGRLDFLARELRSRRPLLPRDLRLEDPVQRDVLATLREASRQPAGALGAYVVSHCSRASDVLAVRLLQKECVVDPPLRVVPLFETEEDLGNAGEVLDRLFSVEPYRVAIHDRQEVMLGYSDSAKDSGRLAAAWALYEAQERIVDVCRRHDVRPTLFHGRGGTIGRGGGPTWLAIRSQPPGSIDGRLRVTEQGEMIEAKFGMPGIALRSLELYLTAVASATLERDADPTPAWRETMARIASRSSRAYRSMVRGSRGFLDYFHTATPIEELGHMRIGSRPARRAPGRDVESLRAIPWVFAWTQMRLMTPTWLGLDEAFAAEVEAGGTERLRTMYRDWPFFRATVDLIGMTLAKTEPRIAAAYDERLCDDAGREIGEALRDRRDAAVRHLLDVTGEDRLLRDQPVLRRSIDVRNPYVDPINLVQVELLHRLRNAPLDEGDRDELRHALLVTINGIAAGMRNTG